MRKALRILVPAFGFVALLGALHLWLLDGLDGWLLSRMLREDTVYAQSYTDSGFRRVRIGMTEAEVHRVLGPPLDRWALKPDRSGEDAGERWSFSPGDTNYRCRVILFRHGRVAFA